MLGSGSDEVGVGSGVGLVDAVGVGEGSEVGVGDGDGLGPVPETMNPLYRRRFGEPDPALVTLPVVALEFSAEATAAGEEPGLTSRY